MKDTYVILKSTGELIPATQAIHEFYKTHKWNEAWTDEYTPTDMEVDDTCIRNPLQCILDSVNI